MYLSLNSTGACTLYGKAKEWVWPYVATARGETGRAVKGDHVGNSKGNITLWKDVKKYNTAKYQSSFYEFYCVGHVTHGTKYHRIFYMGLHFIMFIGCIIENLQARLQKGGKIKIQSSYSLRLKATVWRIYVMRHQKIYLPGDKMV